MSSQREAALEQIKAAKAELEMIKSKYNQKEADEIRQQMEQLRDELQSIILEKERKTTYLDNLDTKASELKTEFE